MSHPDGDEGDVGVVPPDLGHLLPECLAARRRPVGEARRPQLVRVEQLVEGDDRFREQLPTEDDLDEVWRHLVAELGDYSHEALKVFEMVRFTSG